MDDPRKKTPDTPPSPERDTSREGREEEVINQQDDKIINAESNTIVNSSSSNPSDDGEQEFRQGLHDDSVKLDEVDKEIIEGSDQTGREESGLPGSGI